MPSLSRTGGFTLLELLIAITLLSMIMVMLSGGLSMGTRAWDASARHLETSSRAQVVHNFLRRQIAQARPVNLTEDEEIITFAGDRDRLTWVTLLPPYLAAGGFYELTLRAEGVGERAQLVLEWQDYFLPGSAADEVPEPRRVVLMDAIQAVTFDYFGRVRRNDDPAWRSDWRDRPRPPQLLRMTVDFPEGDPRIWPTLVVAPMIDEIGIE